MPFPDITDVRSPQDVEEYVSRIKRFEELADREEQDITNTRLRYGMLDEPSQRRLAKVQEMRSNADAFKVRLFAEVPGAEGLYRGPGAAPSAPSESTGIISRGADALQGLLGVGKRAVTDIGKMGPAAALATLGEGATGFASLPFRAARGAGEAVSEALVGPRSPGQPTPARDPLSFLHEKVSSGAQALRQGAGVPEGTTGQTALEAAGSVVVPVGPMFKAGEHVKNILKGTGFAEAAGLGEDIAAQRAPSAEDIKARGVGGGGISALLSGLFFRGRGRGAAVDAAAETGGKGAPEAGGPEVKPSPGSTGGAEGVAEQATVPPANPEAEVFAAKPEGAAFMERLLGKRAKPAETPVAPGQEGQQNLEDLLKLKGAKGIDVKYPEKFPQPSGEMTTEGKLEEAAMKKQIEPVKGRQLTLLKGGKEPKGETFKEPDLLHETLLPKAPPTAKELEKEIGEKIAREPVPKMPPREGDALARVLPAPEKPIASTAAKPSTLEVKPLVEGAPDKLREVLGMIQQKPPVGKVALDMRGVKLPPEASPEFETALDEFVESKLPKDFEIHSAKNVTVNTDVGRFQLQMGAGPAWVKVSSPRQKVEKPSEPSHVADTDVASGSEQLPAKAAAPTLGKIAKPKPALPKQEGFELERLLRSEGYKLNTDPKTGETVVLREPSLQEEYRFNPKDSVDRARAIKFFEEERGPFGEPGKPIKLYSGIDITRVPEDLKAIGANISKVASKAGERLRDVKSALLAPASGEEKLSPLTRSLKVGPALARAGEIHSEVIWGAKAMEDAQKRFVNNLRYKDIPAEHRFEPTGWEQYDRLPANEMERVNAAWRKLEKGEAEVSGALAPLSPLEKEAFHGTQDALKTTYKAVETEALSRAAWERRKKGATPKDFERFMESLSDSERKELKSLLGIKLGHRDFYFPHRWHGSFEIWRFDGAGNPVSKVLTPVEGLAPSEGRSFFGTRASAELYRFNAARDLGLKREELQVVDRTQPGFRRHLEARIGALGYEQKDMAQVARDYIFEAAAWIEKSKYKRAIGPLLADPKLGAEDKLFLQAWTGRVLGEEAKFDVTANNYLRKLPVLKNIMDPYAPYTQMMKGARKFATHLSLGMGNIGAAIVNADSLARHVGPGLAREAIDYGSRLKDNSAFAAERYLTKAVRDWLNNAALVGASKAGKYEDAITGVLMKTLGVSKESRYLVQKLAHNAVSDIQILGEPLPAAHTKLNALEHASLMAFSTTEDLARTSAAVASYRMARDAGLNEQQALEKASQFVAEKIGRYSPAGRPMVYSSEAGKTLGMFKTYLHVMIDNAYLNTRHPIKEFGAFARYALATTAVAGLAGIPFAKDLSNTVRYATGEDPLDWAHRNLPLWLTNGGLAELGLDLSERTGIADVIPNKGEDWLGPVYNKMAKPGALTIWGGLKDVMRVSRGEPSLFWQDVAEHIDKAMPNTIGFKYLKNVVNDNLYDSKGHLILKDMTDEEQALKFLGLPSTREVENRRLLDLNAAKTEQRSERASEIVRARLAGRLSDEQWSEMRARYHITSEMIKAEKARRDKELLERRIKGSPQFIRREIRESASSSNAKQ